MPKDNIDRAIAKGAGTDADSAAYETVVYEGYGPAGVAVIVEALTDNRNRTAGEVRHTFAKNDGNLGTSGAVAWLFERRGLVLVPADGTDEDELMLAAAEGGAEDVALDGSTYQGALGGRAARGGARGVEGAGFEIESAELTMLPKTTVAVEDENEAKKILRLIDQLEDERRRAGGLRELRHPRARPRGGRRLTPATENELRATESAVSVALRAVSCPPAEAASRRLRERDGLRLLATHGRAPSWSGPACGRGLEQDSSDRVRSFLS